MEGSRTKRQTVSPWLKKSQSVSVERNYNFYLTMFGSAAPPANQNLLQTPVKQSNPNQADGQTNPFGFGDNNTLSPGQQNQGATGGGGLFGATQGTSQTGLFGSNSKPANSSGGLFGGAPASTGGGGLFGGAGSTQQTPNISVGPLGGSTAGTSTGGLFGGQASKPATGGGLFSGSAGTASTGGSTGGGLFGNSSTTGGSQGMFGAQG